MGQAAEFPGRFRAGLARLAAREPFRLPLAEIPSGFRNSAVLVAFWPEDDDVCVVLTRRSSRLAQHAGQTAFPGGRLDAGETWAEAALREAHEEIGLDPRGVEILGPLDDAWSGAGHLIVPVVGWLTARPDLRPNPAEVAEILFARVSELLRPESRGTIAVVHRGVHYRNPTLQWRGGDANGLSADLLLEAIGWGMGERPDPGPERLAHLRTYFGPD
ncbi:MAG: CoA pyrophosphatase [Myxococcota bacterium]